MANGNGDNRKRKASLLDDQFDFSSIDNWRQGKKQKVWGCELIKHNPIKRVEEQPLELVFEIKNDLDFWGFGPNTRFKIEGQFQSKDGDGPWTACTADDLTKAIVIPNWKDVLIKSFKVYKNGLPIETSEENRNFSPSLNAWKYNNMNKEQKRELCPQDSCPGNGVPSKKGDEGWSMNANSEWVTGYGKKILLVTKILNLTMFHWTLHHFSKEQTIWKRVKKFCPCLFLAPSPSKFCLLIFLITFLKQKMTTTKSIDSHTRIFI